MAVPLLVWLVPASALAALGGAYAWAALPLLLASAAVFLVSGAGIARERSTRAMDFALLSTLGVIVLQLVPLPAAMAAGLSPQVVPLQDLLALRPAAGARTLSIDPRLTREALATAAASVLLFWAARETFARGGVRLFARAIAWGGFAAALAGLIQRATAPDLLWWRWKPIDPGAHPFGPFVNRNHFAAWLLMASSLSAGYLVAHLRSHGLDGRRSGRLLARDLLADGPGLILLASLGSMLLALVASLSRAALLGTAAALWFALARGRRVAGRDTSAALTAALVVALVAAALWVNREGLVRRLEAAGAGEVGRPAIWADTLPVIGDFWLTGTGAGTYAQAMVRYQRERSAAFFNDAHSEYLQVASEGGLLLVAAAAAAVWLFVRLARRQLAHDASELNWVRIGAAAGLCGVAVQSLFEGALRVPANLLLFAALAAVVVYERR